MGLEGAIVLPLQGNAVNDFSAENCEMCATACPSSGKQCSFEAGQQGRRHCFSDDSEAVALKIGQRSKSFTALPFRGTNFAQSFLVQHSFREISECQEGSPLPFANGFQAVRFGEKEVSDADSQT
jgi:hypothetical protein